jgi:hypothetical protein
MAELTGKDRIAGQVGDYSRTVAIGKRIRQEDHSQHFDFDFGRAREEVDDDMSEVSRLIREFYRQIALLEYRLAEQEKKFNMAAVIIGGLLLLILWKLFFGLDIEVMP